MLKRNSQFALVYLSLALATLFSSGVAAAAERVMARSAGAAFPFPLPSPTPAQPVAQQKPTPPRYIELGKSVKGTPILAAIFGNGKKRVIIFGGIHGNESDSSIVAKALMGSFFQETAPEELTVIVVPDANPDGLLANTRVNARGVDINRNFPSTSWKSEYLDENQFPGMQPASEPETVALLKLLESSPPDFIITLHAAMGCVNWDGPGEQLARVIASVNGYPLCGYLGYDTPGSLGTFMGVDRKLPVVTIELRRARASELVAENLPALRAVLSYMSSSR